MINITEEDIKRHITVVGGFDPTVLNPHIDPVERRYILALLGKEMLAKIDDYSNNQVKDSVVLSELLTLCQRAEIMLAFDLGYPQISVQIGSFGVARVETESQKSLYGYQERNLRESFKSEGYNALEDIVALLESNIDNEDIKLWKDSDVCANMNSMLINSATEFTKVYAPLKNSRLVFLNLLASQKYIMDTVIKSVVPDTVLDSLQELILDREIADATHYKERKLLDAIQKPLAYLTIADAVDTIGISYNDRGLMFTEITEGADNKKEISTPSRLEVVKKDALRKGNNYLVLLKEFLLKNGIASTVSPSVTGYDFYKSGKKIVRV